LPREAGKGRSRLEDYRRAAKWLASIRFMVIHTHNASLVGSGMPAPFLEERGSIDKPPILALTLCAGFEQGVWREKRFVEYLFDWLPRFALKAKEREYLEHAPFTVLKKSLYQFYELSKVKHTETRGEIGELLLHICCVEFFGTAPVILTVFYKTASNETIKGWDCIHYRKEPKTNEIELWLGEAKFYEDANPAISAAVKSVKDHMEAGFLNAHKIIVGSKIEDDFEDYSDIKNIFDLNTSMDELLKRLVVPILITYDSSAVSSASIVDETYISAVQGELKKLFDTFLGQYARLEIVVKVIFIPLRCKDDLVKLFDEKVKVIQQ
jgi:hypothetical protein